MLPSPLHFALHILALSSHPLLHLSLPSLKRLDLAAERFFSLPERFLALARHFPFAIHSLLGFLRLPGSLFALLAKLLFKAIRSISHFIRQVF